MIETPHEFAVFAATTRSRGNFCLEDVVVIENVSVQNMMLVALTPMMLQE